MKNITSRSEGWIVTTLCLAFLLQALWAVNLVPVWQDEVDPGNSGGPNVIGSIRGDKGLTHSLLRTSQPTTGFIPISAPIFRLNN